MATSRTRTLPLHLYLTVHRAIHRSKEGSGRLSRLILCMLSSISALLLHLTRLHHYPAVRVVSYRDGNRKHRWPHHRRDHSLQHFPLLGIFRARHRCALVLSMRRRHLDLPKHSVFLCQQGLSHLRYRQR